MTEQKSLAKALYELFKKQADESLADVRCGPGAEKYDSVTIDGLFNFEAIATKLQDLIDDKVSDAYLDGLCDGRAEGD